MMRTILKAGMAIAMFLIFSASASYADKLTFTANLVGSLEVPPSGSPATGSATVVIDTGLNTMQVDVTFSGLGSGTTASHIHCCLPPPAFSSGNAGVATTTPTFTGFPSGVTSGTYSHLFDLTAASSYNPAFVTAQGATVAGAEAALIAGIQAGETYLNIHTTNFGGGEIRGFLTPVPEPGTIFLLGSGLFGLICAGRKLSRQS